MVNNIDVEIFFKHCRTNLVMHDVIYDFIAYVFFFFLSVIYAKGQTTAQNNYFL